MDSFQNTRRYPRISAEYPLLAELIESETEGGFGLTNVVGLGGLSFVANRKFGINSKIKLTISIQSRVVEAEARIVYENPTENAKFEIGVEFTKIAPYDKYTIESIFEEKG